MSTSQSKNVAAGPKSKFQPVNINSVYSGKSAVPAKTAGGATRHGLQSLGKQTAVKRRMPPPASLPSLRSESQGQDPDVALVPTGGQGWGTSDAAQSSLSQAPSQDTNTNNANYTNNTDHKPVAAAPRLTRPELCPPWAIKDNTAGGLRPKQATTTGPSSREFPSLDAAGDGTKTAADLNAPSLRPQKSGAWKSGGGTMMSAMPPDRPSSVPGHGYGYNNEQSTRTTSNASATADGVGDRGKPPPRYDGSFRTAQPMPPPPQSTKVAPYYVMPPSAQAPYRPPGASQRNESVPAEAVRPSAAPNGYDPSYGNTQTHTNRRTLLTDDGEYQERYEQQPRYAPVTQPQAQPPATHASSAFDSDQTQAPVHHEEHPPHNHRTTVHSYPVARSTGVVWSEDEDDRSEQRRRSVPLAHERDTDNSSASPAANYNGQYMSGKAQDPSSQQQQPMPAGAMRAYAAYGPAMVPMYVNGQGPPPEWFAAHPPPPMLMQHPPQMYQPVGEPVRVNQSATSTGGPGTNYRAVPADYQTRDFEQEEAELKRNEDLENQEREAAINRARQRRKLADQSSGEWDAKQPSSTGQSHTSNTAAALNSYYFDVADEPQHTRNAQSTGSTASANTRQSNTNRLPPRLQKQMDAGAGGRDTDEAHYYGGGRQEDRDRTQRSSAGGRSDRQSDGRSSKRGVKSSSAVVAGKQSQAQTPAHEQGEVRILQRPESKESAASYGALSDRSSGREGRHERLPSYRESPEVEEDDELQMQPIAKAPVKRVSQAARDGGSQQSGKDTNRDRDRAPKHNERDRDTDYDRGYNKRMDKYSSNGTGGSGQQSRVKGTVHTNGGTGSAGSTRENAWKRHTDTHTEQYTKRDTEQKKDTGRLNQRAAAQADKREVRDKDRDVGSEKPQAQAHGNNREKEAVGKEPVSEQPPPQPAVNVWQQRAEVRASQERDKDEDTPPMATEPRAEYKNEMEGHDMEQRRGERGSHHQQQQQQYYGQREFYNSRRGTSAGGRGAHRASRGMGAYGTNTTRGGGRGRLSHSSAGTQRAAFNAADRHDRSKLKRKAYYDETEMEPLSEQFAALQVQDHTPRRNKDKEPVTAVEGTDQDQNGVSNKDTDTTETGHNDRQTTQTTAGGTRRGGRGAQTHAGSTRGRGRGGYSNGHGQYPNGEYRERRYPNGDYNQEGHYRAERGYRDYNNEGGYRGRGTYKTYRHTDTEGRADRYNTQDRDRDARRAGHGGRLRVSGRGRGSVRDGTDRHSQAQTGTNHHKQSQQPEDSVPPRHVKSPPTSDGVEEWETASESSQDPQALKTHTDVQELKSNKRQGVSFSANRHSNAQHTNGNAPGSKPSERSVKSPNNQTMTGSKNVKSASRHTTQNKNNASSTAAPRSTVGYKPDALAGFDINNYAGVVVIDDQPDELGASETMDGFQQVVSKKEKRLIKERKEQQAAIDAARAKKAAAAAEGRSRAKIARTAAREARNQSGNSNQHTRKDTDKAHRDRDTQRNKHAQPGDEVVAAALVADPMCNISTWQPSQGDTAATAHAQHKDAKGDAFSAIEHFESEVVAVSEGAELWSTDPNTNTLTDMQPVGFARHLSKKETKGSEVSDSVQTTPVSGAQTREAPKADSFDFTFDASLVVATNTNAANMANNSLSSPVQLSADLKAVVGKLSPGGQPTAAALDTSTTGVAVAQGLNTGNALSPKQQAQSLALSSDNELSEKLNAVRAVWDDDTNANQPTVPVSANTAFANNEVSNPAQQQQSVSVSAAVGPQVATVRPQPQQLPLHLSASNTPTPPAPVTPANALCIDPGFHGAQSLFGGGAAFGLATDLSNMSMHTVRAPMPVAHQYQQQQQHQQLFAQQQYQQHAFDAQHMFAQANASLASPPVLSSSQYNNGTQQMMQQSLLTTQLMQPPLLARQQHLPQLDSQGMFTGYGFGPMAQTQASPWMSTSTSNGTALATHSNAQLLTVTNGPPPVPVVHQSMPPPSLTPQQAAQPAQGFMFHDMLGTVPPAKQTNNKMMPQHQHASNMFMRQQTPHSQAQTAKGGVSMSVPPPAVIGPNHYTPLMHPQHLQHAAPNMHSATSPPPSVNQTGPAAPNMSAPPPPVHMTGQQPQVNLSQPPPPLFGAVGSQRGPAQSAFKKTPFGSGFNTNAPPPMNMTQPQMMMSNPQPAFDRSAGLLGKAPPATKPNSVFMPPHSGHSGTMHGHNGPRGASPPLGVAKMFQAAGPKPVSFGAPPPAANSASVNPYMSNLPTGPVHATNNRAPVVPIQRPRKGVQLQPAKPPTKATGDGHVKSGAGEGATAAEDTKGLDASTSLEGDLLHHIDHFISNEQTDTEQTA